MKQLLQDVEQSGIDPRIITLEDLTLLNKSFYGSKKSEAAEAKEKRRKLSLNLSNIKRIVKQSIKAYNGILLKNRVEAGPITKSLLKCEEEGKAIPEPTENVDLSQFMAALGIIDMDIEEEETGAVDGKANTTPPRPTTLANPSMNSPLFRSPPAYHHSTPPRTVFADDSGFGTSSVASYQHSMELSLEPKGTEKKPEVFSFNPSFPGRYTNAYHVFQPPEMEHKKISYRGVVIAKKVDPSDILEYSAAIPSQDYMADLLARGVLTSEQASMPAILFKGPTVEAGDKVGVAAVVDIKFPCPQTQKAVSKHHAKVTKEDSPYFWTYTLGLFDLGGDVFDNRIFSDNDTIVETFESVPKPVEVIDGDKTMHWHIFWRVAIKASGEELLAEKKESFHDYVKRRRKGN